MFAAFLDHETVNAALQLQDAENNLMGDVAGEFLSTLAEVRATGLAMVAGSPVPGVRRSAPMFDHSMELVCVLTVTGQEGGYDHDAHGATAHALLETAHVLSTRLGMTARLIEAELVWTQSQVGTLQK